MDNAGSPDLQWFLLRGWNSKVVKRGSAGFTFSSEAGNLRNVHSYKYSGLVQAKSVAITPSAGGGVVITTRKEGSHPRQISAARQAKRVRGKRLGTRKAAGVAAKVVKNYRADIAREAVVRATRVAKTTGRKSS